MTNYSTEAIVLRTWPFREADLLITLFTRQQGKVRGVAKSAMKSRKRFGGALEPMTHVRAHYAEKPKQELVRLDNFEIITSPLAEPVDYARATGLAFIAEVLDELLPDHDPHDAVFRLTLTTLEHLRTDALWLPVTYFSLWVTRLMGWLPELTRCVECGDPLTGSQIQGAYFHASSDGLFLRQPSPTVVQVAQFGFAATCRPDAAQTARIACGSRAFTPSGRRLAALSGAVAGAAHGAQAGDGQRSKQAEVKSVLRIYRKF